MSSSAVSRSVIDQIKALDTAEVLMFLSTQKGFRHLSSDINSIIGHPIPSIHLVAGKDFETAEEAEEWLSYVVALEGSQSIDQPDRWSKRTPLQAACFFGNSIGVNWLVTHGASVNSKPSPYFYACASSIDAFAKMIILEEHGCIFPTEAIFYAASANFESAEKADEVLRRIVDKNGASVNDIHPKENDTPLHCACRWGSIHGVVWLVEHNAVTNSVRKGGVTPFMYACSSDRDRFLKARYICERDTDCLAKDKSDRSALFYATASVRSCKDDAKEFLHYVSAQGLDVNSISKKGKTPLLHVASASNSLAIFPRRPSVDFTIPEFSETLIRKNESALIIQCLIELGADVAATDSMNRNALHLAAMEVTFKSEVIKLLIESGVDVTCQDKECKAPHHVARDGKVRKLLRQHYDTARFSFLHEKVRPVSMKVCVIGSEMAGKTTFVNALFEVDCVPIDPNDRTAGVDVRTGYIPGVGRGSTWDFGAQWTFHAAHGLFFASTNTIFILVLRLSEDGKTMSEGLLLEQGRYWCAFAKAPLRNLLSDRESLISVLIIGNVVGSGEEAGVEAGYQLKRVARTLDEEFGDTFNFAHVLEMDCSRSASQRMNDCREKLKKLREDVLTSAEGVPKLCHEIEEKLTDPDEKRQLKLGCFMTAQQFDRWVDTDVEVNLAENERKISVEYLDSSGIIVNLGRRICLRPVWLCRNVIGPLLAPPFFPFAMKTGKKGQASTNDIKSALEAFEDDLKHKGIPSRYSVAVHEAIEVLSHLELCFELEDSHGVYQIPALLDDTIPANAWCEDSTMDVYRGQRYECLHSIDIISPSSFVILQCRCYHMPNVSHRAWKNGIKLVKIVQDKDVECLITMGIKNGHHCIDVIVRWSSKDDCEAVAKEFLDELKSMIALVCDERSPGVALDWFYLDSSHLQQLSENPAIYSSREVDQKIKEKAFDHKVFSTRPERDHRRRIKDLVIIVPGTAFASGLFPADEDPVSEHLLRACAAVDGADWELMSLALGISSDDRYNIKKSGSPVAILRLNVLEFWKKQTKKPTVGSLLRLLKEAGIGRNGIEAKYDDPFGRS